MSGAFCGFETEVEGPKGGQRQLRVEVTGGNVTFRLDGAPVFSMRWFGGMAELLEQLAGDAARVCNLKRAAGDQEAGS